MPTWTHEQTGATTPGNSVTPSLAYASDVKAGSLLIAVYEGGGDRTGFTLSDTLGNTWTRIGPGFYDANDQTVVAWYAISNGAGANTVSVSNYVGNTFQSFIISEFSVDSGTISLDAQDINGIDTATGTDGTVFGPINTEINDELILAYIGDTAGANAAFSPGTNFTERADQVYTGGGGALQLETRVLATAGSVSGVWTAGGVGSAIAGVAAFKAAVVLPEHQTAYFRTSRRISRR